MNALLGRLGDRVVDLREAYESVTAEKAGGGGGERFGSRVCCDDLMKLFWTVGVDDAGEIVRDYETLLRKEYGEDTSAFLSFDDFLRVYDYHEQSILGPGGGGAGANARLGGRSTLRPAPRDIRLAGSDGGGAAAAVTYTDATVGTGGAMQATARRADMGQQQWLMSGGQGASATSSRNSAQGQALRAAFDKYDVDKDGLISFLDLRTRFRQMGRTNVPDLEIRRWIADKDRRGAGNVSFDEFERAYGHIKAGARAGRGGGVRLGGTGASTMAASAMSASAVVSAERGKEWRGRDERGDGAAGAFDGVDASDVKRMRESITAGRRAERELEDMEQKELLRLFNGNQELMVRGRAFFDRFDTYNHGVVPAERLKSLLEQMGYR